MDEQERTHGLKEVVGQLAHWATRQYWSDLVPRNLEGACYELYLALAPDFPNEEEATCNRWGTFTPQQLEERVLRAFGKCPLIESWNEPFRGEFVDLHALARNMVRSLCCTQFVWVLVGASGEPDLVQDYRPDGWDGVEYEENGLGFWAPHADGDDCWYRLPLRSAGGV